MDGETTLADLENQNEVTAIEQILSHQNDKREKNLEIQGLDVKDSEIPILHPRILKVSLYRGEAAYQDEEYNPSAEDLEVDYGEQVDFDSILNEEKKTTYTCIVGYPGSGKTVTSKRLAKGNRYVRFRLNFMDMNYGDRKLTLQELLLDDLYEGLSHKTYSYAFKWIKKNQKDCVIIMDGYDQAEWTVNAKVFKYTDDTRLYIWDIISCLFSRHFLPGVQLIVTSRPHSMLSLPKRMRPDLTLLLKDFSFEDMKILFFAYAKHEGEMLWNKLKSTAPQLLSFCLNPMMLQFCIRALLCPLEKVGNITTITRIFATVLENLRHDDHTKGPIDIAEITQQLARIAYSATMQGTILIKVSQLEMENLCIEDVQDLVIAVQGYFGIANRLFDGDKKLYFTHPCLQECFTAFKIVHDMSFDNFCEVAEQRLFTPRWAMVRKFVCGLLVDMETSKDDESCRKRMLFKEKLIQRLGDPGIHKKTDLLLDAWIDVRECNNDDILQKAADLCPSVANFSMHPLTASHAHAISSVLKKVSKQMEKLDLYSCSLDTYSFNLICKSIKDMPGSVDVLCLVGNNLSSEAVTSLCDVLPKIKKAIMMWDLFDNDLRERDATADEQQKLQAALNDLPSTELEIKLTPRLFLRKANGLGNAAENAMLGKEQAFLLLVFQHCVS